MNIILAGGTGFVGKSLTQALLDAGHRLTILTRSEVRISGLDKNPSFMPWNPEAGSPVPEIDGSDAVINLAGEPIFGRRWSAEQKKKILASRISGTKALVDLIEKAVKKPSVLINASAVGYYGSRGDEMLTEESSAGKGFLAEVCKVWETEAARAESFGLRVVRLRIGLVLHASGGVLGKMLPAFKLGLGGWFGKGNQWMSWIGLDDLIRLILFCLEKRETSGAVNAVSPNPMTNKDFSNTLAHSLNRPCFAPVPSFVLKVLLGEAAGALLTGQKVIPQKVLSLGFSFTQNDLEKVLA